MSSAFASKLCIVHWTIICALAFVTASSHAGTPEKSRKNGATPSVKTTTPARSSSASKPAVPTQRPVFQETIRIQELRDPRPRLGAVVAQRIDDAVVEVLHRAEAAILSTYPPVPYLQDTSSPGIRVLRSEPFVRRPPLLPKIITPADKVPAVPAGLPKETPQVPEGNDDSQKDGKNTMDEVVDFFRDSGDRQGNDKGLGDAFDPTFSPAPVPPPVSSATYRRE